MRFIGRGNTLEKIIRETMVQMGEIVMAQITDGYEYVSTFLSIFTTLAVSNIYGLTPFGYTMTAQFVVTLSFSFAIFFWMVWEGVRIHKFYSLSFFLPAGTPIALIPLLVLIEGISFLSRIISLAVRLAANLLSGHILLKIIATTCWTLISQFTFLSLFFVIPFSLTVLFNFVELFVALLQVYIFIVISSCYMNDAKNLH